jgi:hypothetical protein
MLSSHRVKASANQINVTDSDEDESSARKTKQQIEQLKLAHKWKNFRPELHKKTFFKGTASLTMGMEGSLNLKDETARNLVKDAFKIAGHQLPEQSLEERLKEKNQQIDDTDFKAIDDLSEDERDNSNDKR